METHWRISLKYTSCRRGNKNFHDSFEQIRSEFFLPNGGKDAAYEEGSSGNFSPPTRVGIFAV